MAPVGNEVLRLLFAALDRAGASPCRGRCRASIHKAVVADLTLHTARSVTITTRREHDQGGWGGAGLERKRVWEVFVLLQVRRVQISERSGQARAGNKDSSVRVKPGSTHTPSCPSSSSGSTQLSSSSPPTPCWLQQHSS